MIKNILKVEFKKIFEPIKVFSLSAGLVLLILLTSVIIFTSSFTEVNNQNQFISFLILNLSFGLMHIILPIITIFLSSYIFASEFSSGAIQKTLLCGIKRDNLYLSKFIWVQLLILSLTLIIILSLTIIAVYRYGDFSVIFTKQYTEIFCLYILSGLSCTPIALITVLFSFLFENSEQTVLCSFVFFCISQSFDMLYSGNHYSPTSMLNLIGNTNSISLNRLIFGVAMLLCYFIVFNTVNLSIFKKKDIWN